MLLAIKVSFSLSASSSKKLWKLILGYFTNFIIFISSYSDILIEREVLMQKYIHLVQIVETEKIAANQLRHQLEDQDTEIERLKSEVFAKISM